MVFLIWGCLLADVTAAIFLIIASMSSGQDAAGKEMVFLPSLLLIGLAILGYILLQKHLLVWSLVVSGLPVIVILYLLFISVT